MNRHKLTIAAAAALATFGAGNAFAQGNSATTSASATMKIAAPLTLGKTDDLRFGTIVKSTVAGTNTIKIDSTGGTCTRSVVSGGTGDAYLLNSTTGCARLVMNGEPGQAFTITVPAAGTVSLSDGTTSLPITFNHSPSSPNSLLPDGTTVLVVGGQFPISDTATAGTYTASFNVTVAYQ